jgi:hypothetical protein
MLPATLLPVLAQLGNEASRVGAGRIQGGWEYVWTSYAIAWAGIALYGLSLWMRFRKQQLAAKENP